MLFWGFIRIFKISNYSVWFKTELIEHNKVSRHDKLEKSQTVKHQNTKLKHCVKYSYFKVILGCSKYQIIQFGSRLN